MIAFKLLRHFGFPHPNHQPHPNLQPKETVNLNQEGFSKLFQTTLDSLTQEKITYDCLFENIYPLLRQHRALARELFHKLPEEKTAAYDYFREWLKNLKEEKN